MIRLKKIRDSAKDEACTVQSSDCNGDPETTRLIHYRTLEDGAGTGFKPDDTSAVYACSDCDLYLGEGNRGSKDIPLTYEYFERQMLWFRAMRRTWALLVTNGVLK